MGYANKGKLTDATRTACGQIVTHRYDYDAAGRLVRQRYDDVDGADREISSLYWRGGELRSRSFPDAATPQTASYGYDAIGRLSFVKLGASFVINSTAYNGRSQPTTVVYANGTQADYVYTAGRSFLDTINVTAAGATRLALDYTRDPLGRITKVLSDGNHEDWAYQYDDLGRLTFANNLNANALDQSFTYDLADNLLSNSKVGAYTYPTPGPTAVRPHAPTHIAGEPVTYDANGNVVSYSVGTTTRSIAWDGENRPKSLNGGIETYTYGPDGERYKRTLLSGAKTITYLGGDAEFELVTAGTVKTWTQYLHADVLRRNGALSWLHKDHLSSNRLNTGNTGAAEFRTGYTAFGKPYGTPP